MKELLVAALLLLTGCLSTLQAQTLNVAYGSNPDNQEDDFEDKTTWYVLKMEDKYLAKDNYGIAAVPLVDGIEPQNDARFQWMFYKDEEGIYIYSRAMGYLSYRVPQYARNFWVSDGEMVRTGVRKALNYSAKNGLSMQSNNKTFYLDFGDNGYLKWTTTAPNVKIQAIDLKSFQKAASQAQGDKRAKMLQIAAQKQEVPMTAEEIQARKDRAARIEKAFTPNPQGALQKVHQILNSAQQNYSELLAKEAGSATIKFRYDAPDEQAHFPLNDFRDILGYGTPKEGHPNAPVYIYHVTVTPTSLVFHLIDNNIMLASGTDANGDATTPADPFKQVWGCTSGSHTVSGAQFALPGHHTVKVNGSASCEHSHRVCPRGTESSMLGNGTYVTLPNGQRKEKAGHTDYYPDHCYNHEETVTFHLADMAKECNLTMAQMLNLMLQDGVLYAGQTDDGHGTFIANQCMRDCLVWALWNACGFTDQKFLDTYVWADETAVEMLKKGEEIKDKIEAYDHLPSDNETALAEALHQDVLTAWQLVKDMKVSHVDSYTYTHDMCRILLNLGLWDWGRTFGLTSLNDMFTMYKSMADFPAVAKQTACRDWARVCKCEILALAHGENEGDGATEYYKQYANPQRIDLWNGGVANYYNAPNQTNATWFDCTAKDNFALYELFINENPRGAAEFVREIMENEEASRLDLYPSYRIMHEMYPDYLQ